jgi:phosphatidylserine/phosphatidylglycerophosphate/cardiolipin synthase-like enzyme
MGTDWSQLPALTGATRNKAEVLLDGTAYFKSVAEAIETATTDQHYIYILAWMLDICLKLIAGDNEKTLLRLLRKAAERGVEIRVLIWDNLLDPDYTKLQHIAIAVLNTTVPNSRAFIDPHTFFPKKSRNRLNNLQAGLKAITGGSVGMILKATGKFGSSFGVNLVSGLDKVDAIINAPSLGAHHEKVVIVKGKNGLIAYCGGMDFNKNRVMASVERPIKMVDQPFPTYHDTACRIEGPAAFEILKKFKLRWSNHPDVGPEKLRGEAEIPLPTKDMNAPLHYVKVVGTYNSPDGSKNNEDRSVSKAYHQIIEKAERYIYIEDQYLVNLDVAAALNKKITDTQFKGFVFFATQDTAETDDILIPKRKRQEFLDTVRIGATPEQERRVCVASIDRPNSDYERYHPGMHAKTLIVDDEIAIIGSANLNQRGFTVDSETSVVVFDDVSKVDTSFARLFRIATWADFIRRPQPINFYDPAFRYPSGINGGSTFSKLIKYEGTPQQEDLDVRINTQLKESSVPAILSLLSQFVTAPSVIPTPQAITNFFEDLWNDLIDPKAD